MWKIRLVVMFYMLYMCAAQIVVSALFLDDFQLDVYILMVRWVHNITLHFCTEM